MFGLFGTLRESPRRLAQQLGAPAVVWVWAEVIILSIFLDSMKLIRYVLLGFVLVTSLASAQTDSTERAKMIGLRFSFNGLNLGGGLGGKYWLSSQSAVVGGISFVSRSNISASSEATFSILAQYEYHFTPQRQISPYIAGGLNLGFGNIAERGGNSIISRPTFSVGASAIIGVEFFVIPAISLAGQQAFSASFTQNFINTNVSQLVQERWDVGIGASSLILHIYWGR